MEAGIITGIIALIGFIVSVAIDLRDNAKRTRE
jgi:hypothetical protein